MRTFKILFLSVLVIILLGNKGFSQTPSLDPASWSNQWTDDFRTFTTKQENPSGSGLWWIGTSSDQHWQIGHYIEGGDSPELYIKEQISFDLTNGLTITAKQEHKQCSTCVHQDHYYVSGNATRWQDYPTDIKYGYIEAYIKIQRDVFGLWPAFWLWQQGQDGQCTSPNCTCTNQGSGQQYDYDEVDIFEITPGAKEGCDAADYKNVVQNKNFLRTNIHTCLEGGVEDCGQPGCRGKNLSPSSFDYTTWHKYGLEWTPSKIIYYIDDIAVRNSPNPNYPTNPDGDISRKLAIIFNIALNPSVSWDSGNYYSFTCPACTTYFNSSSYTPADINTNPASMYVQWVKYWKPVTDCSTDLTISNNTTLNNYDHKIKHRITISGTSISTSASSPKSLRASDYILISGDFTVPYGTELYIDVNPCY